METRGGAPMHQNLAAQPAHHRGHTRNTTINSTTKTITAPKAPQRGSLSSEMEQGVALSPYAPSRNPRIIAWLSTLPETDRSVAALPQPTASRKRKQSSYVETALPTPKMSSASDDRPPEGYDNDGDAAEHAGPSKSRRELKRARHHASTPDDLEATPRASIPVETTSDLASNTDRSPSKSSASRTSSPTKQLRAVSLFADGFTLRKFGESGFHETAPLPLKSLAKSIGALGRGVGVVQGKLKVCSESVMTDLAIHSADSRWCTDRTIFLSRHSPMPFPTAPLWPLLLLITPTATAIATSHFPKHYK